ncbi:MAG: DUF1549 domain-containing protein [Methylococcaceae bacterium]|nr:DUF1549 domain-containing protein [Methylococcaceae bacterium]MDZ4158030.1 DUF1549 domain-containing protein [Methylococcales bacterium]MDP2392821.1 DUF1549 domain-containing protein [Methylococcaceae bacterium]MDP3020349.1 DUF1549 domain-containing protein [Methylococcaceae bacterium]MDP3391956.1 DUF1549 domain-containing protein [Methylococcaceae bacterium]
MKKKLYLAVMCALVGLVAEKSATAVDTFNNPVGEIGVKQQQNPVAATGSQAVTPSIEATAAPASPTVPVVAENKTDSQQAVKTTLWSYQPVKVLIQPTVNNQNWVKTPIDAFVLAPLESKGLAPSPEADRAAFIRRATIDAWGLIPTPEEVKNFVNDTSSDAYEKFTDRLLASPKYGERQARRWLDLARYADSNGFDNDETRPNLWRYRDYVVSSFNQDKPYDRFIKEQLVGENRDWDAHNRWDENHGKHTKTVDKPIAGLLADLKERGLLDSTLIVWTSEFGRTSYGQSGNGRDHNPWGYTQWLAGGGVKAGTTFGQTDEVGLQAVGEKVDTYDLHATVLQLLELDHLKTTFQLNGRSERPTIVYGKVIKELIA